MSTATNECDKIVEHVTSWLLITSIPFILVTLSSALVLLLIYFQIKTIKKLCDDLMANTHWLSRTAVRVGLSSTAKKALMDYARQKPEFAKLVQNPQ